MWLVAAASLNACSTLPQVAEVPPPPYEQLLEEGQQAQKAGNTQQALERWRLAAKQNPSAKEPWLRMAQMHFDAADYGNAITEAQEAMQRDGSDAVANGLLAVSGLRVSSAALARMQADTLSSSTRGEAEALAKTLREVLGAPVLVPQPPVAATPARTARAPRTSATAQPAAAQPAAAQPVTAPPAGGSKPVAASSSPTVPAKAAARDPFGALR